MLFVICQILIVNKNLHKKQKKFAYHLAASRGKSGAKAWKKEKN